MIICEIIDCDNKAEYEDPMGNYICELHMDQEVEEGTYEYVDYEKI